MNSSFKTFLLGSFDGLHIGHQTLFRDCLSPMGVMVIFNIPRKKQFIFSLENRIQQIKQHFAPQEIMLYDVAKNNISGEEFMKNILLPKKINQIIVGSNFTFGNDCLDALKLSNACDEVIIKPINEMISSSLIKKYLISNNLQAANDLLLNCFFYEGTVVHGRKISRTFQCPTANFLVSADLVKLFSGSYITISEVNNKLYESITFVGQSKTLSDEPWCVQTHLLSKNIDLYNQKIKSYFIKFIRANEKFNSLDLLKEKINTDVYIAKTFFKENNLKENITKWKIF